MSISKSIKQSSEKYNLELNNGLYFFDDATLGMIVNSCGSKGIGDKIVPDSILGVCITPACQVHDFDYFVGQTFEDKKNADRRFLENMRKIIEYESKFWPLKYIRLKIAKGYYDAVKYAGYEAFQDKSL